ncbi:MAG: aminomethyl-transferring glycine dehydrogenase [Bdellovibrionales bacterium]|nr:aminomethyl-transferring glycine dehydrogenase [Bdellovibrionales bacterium]
MQNTDSHPSVETFEARHIGLNSESEAQLLQTLGVKSIATLIDQTIPAGIRMKGALKLAKPFSEAEAIASIREIAEQNEVYRSFIGMGYVDTRVPAVILRNILENPGWYTQYTPYQAEIAQGRLEALLNFQTMIMDFTGFAIANASLLDEGTAAAEAMAMAYAIQGRDATKAFFIASDCHPQTIAVVQTRAKYAGIRTIVAKPEEFSFSTPIFGALLQYPNTFGAVVDPSAWIKRAHDQGALVTLACDLMALVLLKSPAELGADFAVGNTQCFGVPMGFGGPHAAFLGTKDEYKRQMPGRIVGVSKDALGKPAIRLALQTREQHIRRDKATSNICTAQVLLAIMASMYAVYHGPKGVREIASKIHERTGLLAAALKSLGYAVGETFFNTLTVGGADATKIHAAAAARKMNFRAIDGTNVGITLDETATLEDLKAIVAVFGEAKGKTASLAASAKSGIPSALDRASPVLTHPVFNRHHSETEMLRYITRLQGKDLSLAQSMIALGSCTMKLNATTEMLPVTWPEFGRIHPFAPEAQWTGYKKMLTELESQLAEITGFDAISLQPNAGSQGEYAGLLAIRKFQEAKGEANRDVCLIPSSAHGTNPASAVMAGLKVVVVACDSNGNVDLGDLREKAATHAKNLSALMVTYPSTHGVFEESIREICEIVHKAGGQVYMDGANMNAQVGLCRPGDFGADVCHLNLHKTFCIPHGGGGPGMGPIGVKAHLAPHLPNHPLVKVGGKDSCGAVSAAPYGSASILPIPYLYIQMMGADGLRRATESAILSANYVAKKLEPHYPVLYKGKHGFVAHECIVDLRPLKETSGVEVEDVAKRLMDYGFHAPTISFPVPGTMMIEPTESESKAELDRFVEAMAKIREEIREIETGKADRKNNLLKNAPHTAEMIAADAWDRPYSRSRAVYPAEWIRDGKFWPAVARIDNVYGERNLVCACPPIEEYSS